MKAKGKQKIDRKKSQRKAADVKVLRPNKQVKLSVGRIIMFGAITYFVIWTAYPATYRFEQERELNTYKKQLEDIQQQNTKLRKEVKYLSSDDYVEQGARSLGLTMPDEEVVVIIQQESEKPSATRENKLERKRVEVPRDTPLQRLTRFFSGVF